MANTLPVPDGGGDPTTPPISKPSRTKHPRVRHPRAKKPQAPKAKKPTRPIAEPVSGQSVWPRSGAAAAGSISALFILESTTMPDALDLAGAEHAALRATLSAWNRQANQASNRIARRPGGLLRMAGI